MSPSQRNSCAQEGVMKIRIKDRYSRPVKNQRRKWWFWLGPRPAMLVGLVTLLLSFPVSLCLGSPSPRHSDHVEEQSTGTAEIPFELSNHNLIIVKATIGPIKNVNMILDTGTTPTAISQVMADRLNVRGKAGLLQTLNGAIQAHSVVLPRIQIGQMHSDSITGVVQD